MYRKRKHPYTAYVIMILLLGVIYCFSAQQGNISHNMSQSVCEKIVILINMHGKLGLTQNQMEKLFGYLDMPVRKLAHLTEYAILGIVITVIASNYTKRLCKQILIVIGVLIIIGSFDEIHQLFIIAREGKWQDVVVDVIGGSIGMILVFIARHKLFSKDKMV